MYLLQHVSSLSAMIEVESHNNINGKVCQVGHLSLNVKLLKYISRLVFPIKD